jgi:hypothetical protein
MPHPQYVAVAEEPSQGCYWVAPYYLLLLPKRQPQSGLVYHYIFHFTPLGFLAIRSI